jgi:hypothetical protein|tara:strand:+ start:399 stop:587 length:189 start_codon:yes stop_codon:yes gene_type:complete
MLEQDRYRTYADLTLDELTQVVDDLENMSIHALKQNKKELRIIILKSVQEAKKEIEKRLKNN